MLFFFPLPKDEKEERRGEVIREEEILPKKSKCGLIFVVLNKFGDERVDLRMVKKLRVGDGIGSDDGVERVGGVDPNEAIHSNGDFKGEVFGEGVEEKVGGREQGPAEGESALEEKTSLEGSKASTLSLCVDTTQLWLQVFVGKSDAAIHHLSTLQLWFVPLRCSFKLEKVQSTFLSTSQLHQKLFFRLSRYNSNHHILLVWCVLPIFFHLRNE